MPSTAKSQNGSSGELTELQRLLALISVCPSKQQLPALDAANDKSPRSRHHGSHSQSTEAFALEQFSTRYVEERSFHQLKHSQVFEDIFSALVKHRLCQDDWSERAPPENIQRVLSVMRLLMRDQTFQKLFLKLNALKKLCGALERATRSYLECGETPYIVEILTELTNIIQKLSSCSTEHCELIVANGAHKDLVILLSANNVNLLHCTLYALRFLTASERPRSLICELNCIEKIMHILEDYDVDSKRLAAHLLKILCGDQQSREMIKVYDGIPLLLRLLNGDDLKLLMYVVWCLVQLAGDTDTCNDLRQRGVIPLLINLLQNRNYSNASAATAPASATLYGRTNHSVSCEDSQTDETIDQICKLKSACCAALGELAKSDHSSQQIVTNNGVYAVGMLILPDHNHNSVAKDTLQKNALRTLRFLFSMERNRRMFRRIFQGTTQVFSAFTDVGHYVHSIEKYQGVIDMLKQLPEGNLAQLRETIASSNTNREVTQHIDEYDVMEHLGSGAFGSVYKVRKTNSNLAYYALKEVNLNQASLGKVAKEKDKSVGEIISEINIVREQMKHPNIVKYYRTFVLDETKLYIVMELIDGAPLGEHFTSLKEKQQQFTEERIWNIFIQIVLALRYLHKEKKIVHRDLTPNNIMLGENDHVTITDFGLAKAKQREASELRSVVGTILYSCPEIVQSLPYGENADVWAIGCILYQMCALSPPFSTNNMLALAKHIVDGDYKPLPEGVYSPKINETIARCLAVDPKERPDIVGVTAIIAEEFIQYTERMRSQKSSLEKRLEKERKRTQRHHSKANNLQQDYHRLFIASQEKYDKLASLQASGNSIQLTSAFRDENNNNDKGWLSGEEEEPSSSDSSGSASSLHRGFNRPIPPSAPRRKRLDFQLDPLAVEIPDRKARDSGFSSAGEPSPNDVIQSKVSSLSAKHDFQRSISSPQMEVKRQYSTSSTRARPGSGGTTATLSISPRKVRQINDPVQQMLIILHKVIWISQLPPSLEHNPRRSCIEKFKRTLFSMNSDSAHLKTELKKLANGSTDVIDINVGSVDLNGAVNSVKNGTEAEGLLDTGEANYITYEQMLTIIELVLTQSNYYAMPTTGRQQKQNPSLGPISHQKHR